MQQMIGFSVRMKAEDMRDLAPTQVVSFDDVISNAGGGYDSSTGVFTAPASGTYVFYLQTLNHNTRDGRIFLDIIKNGEFLSRVHAGWSPFENGSTLSVTHLEKGDTVNVQVSFGTAFWGGVFTTFSGFRVSSE
ncbi:hypothetical protein BaRGS_00000715 [Batillaria attramentaria]|uniref:C1q domain-containing protein n=1 Tax=Batillaria attramentaria TaxID=370345 RepID=A0ABD0M8B9_9CAEN